MCAWNSEGSQTPRNMLADDAFVYVRGPLEKLQAVPETSSRWRGTGIGTHNRMGATEIAIRRTQSGLEQRRTGAYFD